MKNKTKIAFKMFLESMRQVRLFCIIIAIILVVQIFIAVTELSNLYFPSYDFWSYRRSIFELLPITQTLEVLLLPVMTIMLFGWINHRNESDFYHSLPVKRSALLTGNILTILIWPVALYFGSCFIFRAWVELFVINIPIINYEDIAPNFIITFIAGIMISGALLIGMNLVKSRILAFFVACVILLGPRLFIFVVKTLIEGIMPGIVFPSNIFWDSSYNLLTSSYGLEPLTGYRVDFQETIIYSLILGIIYWIIAGFLFIHRKSEVAEKTAYNSKLEFAVKIILPLALSIAGGFLILYSKYEDHTNSTEIMVVLVMAVALYICIEMAASRSVKAIKNTLPGFVVMLAVNIILLWGIDLYVGYQKGFTPAAEEIEYVIIESLPNDENLYWNEKMDENDPICGIIGEKLTGDGIKGLAEQILNEQSVENRLQVLECFKITVRANGRTVSRYVQPGYLKNKLWQVIENDEQALSFIKAENLPQKVGNKDNEFADYFLYKMYREDALSMDSLTFARVYLKNMRMIKYPDDFENINPIFTMEVWFSEYGIHTDLLITEEFEKTYKYILDMYAGNVEYVSDGLYAYKRNRQG